MGYELLWGGVAALAWGLLEAQQRTRNGAAMGGMGRAGETRVRCVRGRRVSPDLREWIGSLCVKCC
ncbi:hypothetical protein PSm6_41540 [Pseudomonas solani]|uniref:Secreted protein n=1 Tax=Pseudomonas solani TaxID=2731552 RepID=A0ABM7LDQ5_9PSED|nr:hypothetical protein PSm6_41540 [Pseudomonas solani]